MILMVKCNTPTLLWWLPLSVYILVYLHIYIFTQIVTQMGVTRPDLSRPPLLLVLPPHSNPGSYQQHTHPPLLSSSSPGSPSIRCCSLCLVLCTRCCPLFLGMSVRVLHLLTLPGTFHQYLLHQVLSSVLTGGPPGTPVVRVGVVGSQTHPPVHPVREVRGKEDTE